jgi:uncharacterized protein YecE (DUF72 family)
MFHINLRVVLDIIRLPATATIASRRATGTDASSPSTPALSNLRIGTSGWSYREWEDIFYPPGEKSKLSFYTRYFDTVEIDSSFYAYPKKGMIHGLARFTPDDFIFSAKLPKLITHQKKLDMGKGVHADLIRFLDVMKPLIEREKLGPVLIQLPPRFSYEDDVKKLGEFLEALPADVAFAVEFRNLSWQRQESYDLLRKSGVANTIVDEPLLPPDTQVTSPDLAFIRWHGRNDKPWYDYRYKQEELDPWVGKVKDVAAKVRKTYGYFNNHFRGAAVENALQMLEKLGKASKEQKELQEKVSMRIDEGWKRAKPGRLTAGTLLDYDADE